METQQILNKLTPKPKFNLGFFFLSLGLLITLITSVVSFLNLVFGTLDKRFPDVLNSNYQYGYVSYDYNAIRSALATLIIFFPIFLVVSYFWKKFSKINLGKIDEVVRKWLIYIILFLSALVTAIDLVTLVRYFVAGEITTRFILKVVAVLIVALYVGMYFIFELKEREKFFGFKIGTAAVVKSSVLVLAVIVWSFTIIGTPGEQRVWRLDDRRTQDLQNIQYQVINYWQQKEKLPPSLNELASPLTGYSLPVDPEFEKGKRYEYSIVDAKTLTFELCADFALPMPKGWREYKDYGEIVPMPLSPMGEIDTSRSNVSYPYPGPGGGINESWDHQSGKTCYKRTIDKDIYPPYPKPTKY
jgi:hypothetical protein